MGTILPRLRRSTHFNIHYRELVPPHQTGTSGTIACYTGCSSAGIVPAALSTREPIRRRSPYVLNGVVQRLRSYSKSPSDPAGGTFPTLEPGGTGGEASHGIDALSVPLLQSPALCVIVLDAHRLVRRFSPGAQKLFGYDATEIAGRPVTDFLPEPPREPTARPIEVTGLRKDGARLSLEMSITAACADADPQSIVVLHDVTRRKRIEEALHKQAGMLRRQGALLDLAHDAICLRELGTGTILSWNEGAEMMYGWAKGEALGRTVHDLLRTHLPRPLEDLEAELLRAGRWEGDLVCSRRDGTLIAVSSRWAPQWDDSGQPVAVMEISSDITERKKAEAQAASLLQVERETTRRLREIASLRADFTSMVAHELGNPLAAIRSLASMLATDEVDAETHAQALSSIRAEAEALSALVADVQAAATVERDDFSIRIRPVCTGTLITEACSFAATLPGHHPLTTHMNGDPVVLADPERIRQVLRNLLSNAAKYSECGAPIELQVTDVGGRVRIAVEDHGHGIHPADRARIFEKFGRGRDLSGQKVAGVGLGLYLSRRIVQMHGADLAVESIPGKGSVFSFELDVAR